MLQDLSAPEQRDEHFSFTGLMQTSNHSQQHQHSSLVSSATSGAFLPMDLHLAQGYPFFASSHNARKEVLEDFLGGNNPQHIEGHSGILEMRKEKSRDAARSRRGKENYEFYELAKMLPLPPAITSQLDKASIIRLTISFLRLKEFSSNGDPPWIKDNPRPAASLGTASPSGSASATSASASSSGKSAKGRSRSHQQNSQHQLHHQQQQQQQPLHQLMPSHGLPVNDAQIELFDQHQGTHILQSLDGFAFSLGSDGRFLYISETVSIYLGLSQVEMTGSSIFDYVHTGDHNELAQQLGLTLASNQSSQSSSSNGHQQLPPSPASGTGSMDDGSSSMNPDVTSLMSLESNSAYQGLDRCFCIRMKSTLTKRGCHFKSSGYRVVMVLSRLRPLSQQFLSRKSGASSSQPVPLLGMIAMAIALPPPTVHEVRLEPDMFVTRLAFDFRIIHCEPRIAELLEFTPDDLTGRSLYTLCHAEDVRLLRKAHTDLMHKSQVMTPYYRILNRHGGFTWIQSCATVVCNSKNNDEQSIVCVNYVLSRTEMKSLIVDECQLETSSSNSKPYKMESAIPEGIRASPAECASNSPDTEKNAQVPEQADDDAERHANDERRSARLSRSSKRKYDDAAPIPDNREVDNRSVDPRPDSPSIRNQEAADQAAVESARWKRPYELDGDALQDREIDGANAGGTDFSTNALLSNGKRSTIQWIGTPSLTAPSMQLLRQLYASRESVIRANVHAAAAAAAAGRPSGPYFDPNAANSGEFSEAFPPNAAHSYSATTASSFLTDYLPAMTPPSSVSPRDAAGVLFAAEASLRHSYTGLDPSSYSSTSNQPIGLKPHHHYGAGTVEHHAHHHHTPGVHQYANVQPLVSTSDAQFYSHPTSSFHIYPSQIPSKSPTPSANSSVTWFPN